MDLSTARTSTDDDALHCVARLWRTHVRYRSSLPVDQADELDERMAADLVFAADLLELTQVVCDALTSCAIDDDGAYLARSEALAGDRRMRDPAMAAMARFILDACAGSEFERLGCDQDRRAAAGARAEALIATLRRPHPASFGAKLDGSFEHHLQGLPCPLPRLPS